MLFKIIKKIDWKSLGFASIIAVSLTIPLLMLVGSVLVTELPSKLIPYTEVTAKYQEDVLWAKDRLSAMGLNCPQEQNITIYQNLGFIFPKKIDGYVKEDKTIKIIIGSKVSYDQVALNLIKAMGHNCSNSNGKNGENSVFSRMMNHTGTDIKKYGMLQYCKKDSCSYESRKSLSDYGEDSILRKISFLKSFVIKPEVLPYSYIKTDLNLYIDDHETKLALDNDPESFKHNFNKTNKYPLMFQAMAK